MVTVYAYVVGDLLHVGHVRHLRRAAQLGDVLVVGVLTRNACMEKKSAPVIPLKQRMEMVAALRVADQVITQETYSPLDNCRRKGIDILAESEDHKEQPANKWMLAHGKKVVVLPYTACVSSTKIKNRVIKSVIKGWRPNK